MVSQGSSRVLIPLFITLLLLVGVTIYLYVQESQRSTVTVVTTVITGSPTTSPPAPSPSPKPTGTSPPPPTSPSTTGTPLPSQTLPPYTSTGSQTSPPTSPPSNTSATISSPTGPPAETGRPHVVDARLVNPTKVWFAVWQGSSILEFDSSTGEVSTLIDTGNVACECFDPHPAIREKIYFNNPSGTSIYLHISGPSTPRVEEVFKHDTYVRCIRFAPDPQVGARLYFSEAFGAGDDGTIYRIVRNQAEPFATVRLEDVRYWAGHFEFAPGGVVYISNGNTVPASIYEMRNGRIAKIITLEFPIMGLDYVEGVVVEAQGSEVSVTRGLLFPDRGGGIYLLDLETLNVYRIFNDASYGRIMDVSLPP